jgi:gamma-glutamylcyclotransferase (GGCT)/AIG2-like uncharacterized protein YtfP
MLSDQIPVFAYGTLLKEEVQSQLLNDVVIHREPAVAKGRNIAINEEYPAVRFSGNGRDIEGQLLWLNSEAYETALERLDEYEGTPSLFARVVIDVVGGGQVHRAFAYEWANTPAVAGRYLYAIERKIDIASYHFERLLDEYQDRAVLGNHPAISVQAHFEGILLAAAAVGDQLAELINLVLDLDLVNPVMDQVIPRLPKSRVRDRVVRWHNRPITADVRELRRLVAHHWSKKTPSGPVIEVQRVLKGHYSGPRDLMLYAEAVVEHLNDLREMLPDLEAHLSLGDPTPDGPS